MKFKVGDKIRGISDNYKIVNKDMTLAEVVEVSERPDKKYGLMDIKVIEHTDKTKIGLVYIAYNFDTDFELVEEEKMDKIEELETKIKELSDEIEKLKAEKENEPWKPKDGEEYWFIYHSGAVLSISWHGEPVDEKRYAIGNVFKTEEEAEFRAEQLKVEAELRRFARPFEIGGKNYTLQYGRNGDKIDITFFELLQCGNMYFPSEEIAQKAIDTVGADRIKKYYFGVEE